MADSKENRVPLMIRLEADLHRELHKIVRVKYDAGDRRAALNTEINEAVRRMLHNRKEIESLQVDAGVDRILGVPSVPRVLSQADASNSHRTSEGEASADRLREVAELRRTAETAERDTGKSRTDGKRLDRRKRRTGSDAG